MILESGGNTEQEDVSEHPIRYGIIIKMSLQKSENLLDSGEMSPDINQELRVSSTR